MLVDIADVAVVVRPEIGSSLGGCVLRFDPPLEGYVLPAAGRGWCHRCKLLLSAPVLLLLLVIAVMQQQQQQGGVLQQQQLLQRQQQHSLHGGLSNTYGSGRDNSSSDPHAYVMHTSARGRSVFVGSGC